MAELFNQGYALLIGVGECVDTTLSLSVTVQDMKALRQILVDPALCAYPDNDQHIQLLHDQTATKSGILDSLVQLRDRVATDPEATVIVYYSGHGWLEKDTNSYYLIPNDFDRYEWRTTALSATDFNQALQSIKAKRLLVILDCCHAAGIGTAKDTTSLPLPKGVVPSADPKGILDALTQGEGRVVFTSCRGEEQSWVRQDKTLSVYTHHLIEALQGAASQAGTTEVTIFDLANHLGKAVPATAATMNQKQTPRFEMRDTERFAIALLQGGKGLSSSGWKAPQSSIPAEPQRGTTIASGDGAVAIGGNVSGVITTGNKTTATISTVNQFGEKNFNFGTASNFSIGDTRHNKDGSEKPSQKKNSPKNRTQVSSDLVESKEVLISYAWGGKSEEVANQIEQALKKRGIELVRDKNDLGFKGRIKAFMERIGRGKCIVVVISEKYLKSENCMFELVQIAKNSQFHERVFPVVLEDSKIYKSIDRLDYVQHWEGEIRRLDEKLKTVSSANLDGFREDIDLYNEIRRYLPRLTDILKDMNALTAKIHSESEFVDLITAVEQKLAE
jgi:hypothetical protein